MRHWSWRKDKRRRIIRNKHWESMQQGLVVLSRKIRTTVNVQTCLCLHIPYMIISPFLTGQLSPAPSSLWLEDGQMKQFYWLYFNTSHWSCFLHPSFLQFNPLRFCPSQWPSVSFNNMVLHWTLLEPILW